MNKPQLSPPIREEAMTEVKKLVERLTESAAAFRKYPIFTADGDPVLLTSQADELEQAASTLESLDRRVAELVGALQQIKDPGDAHINALHLYEGCREIARSALPDPPGPCEGRAGTS